jgi:phosphoribosylanthranilate isomerase
LSHPFILSGGLNKNNIIEAIDLTGAEFVDINSGVEVIKGEKNLSLIDSLISSLKN